MSMLLQKLYDGQTQKLLREEIIALAPSIKYKDGRTKQTFKDETDINKILQRAEIKGTISHLNKHQAKYGDFSTYNFFENQLMLARGSEIFDDLPAELRKEFAQSPAKFFKYVNDPANKDDLKRLLPALAAPGRQNVAVSGTPTADADTAAVAAEAEAKAAATTDPEADRPVPIT